MIGRIKSLFRGDAEQLANWLAAPDMEHLSAISRLF